MSLTSVELERGVKYWLVTTWPRDFHNGFYRCMADANPRGAFDDAWWSDFLPVHAGMASHASAWERIPDFSCA